MVSRVNRVLNLAFEIRDGFGENRRAGFFNLEFKIAEAVAVGGRRFEELLQDFAVIFAEKIHREHAAFFKKFQRSRAVTDAEHEARRFHGALRQPTAREGVHFRFTFDADDIKTVRDMAQDGFFGVIVHKMDYIRVWHNIAMSLQRSLLNWFKKSQRPLPWRRRYRPYEVWVSEIMLQQTQVETALPYYDRWMKKFPTIASLARASENSVMKQWQGLGYYSRARNLHHTAKEILRDHRGEFPSDFDAIRNLKGVGRYTAGAIASIAFNQTRPIVDGNVLRVLARVFKMDEPIDDLKFRERFWSLQESLIPEGEAREFNQALMELGALVCTKQSPSCGICPIRKDCLAYESDRVQDYPVRQAKRKQVKVIAAAIVLRQKDRYFIHRRPKGRIMGGLWEFPEWKLAEDKGLSPSAVGEELKRHATAEFGLNNPVLDPLGVIKRNYTHHLESLHVYQARITGPVKDARDWPSAWVTPAQFSRHPFSSAHAKITRLIESRSAP